MKSNIANQNIGIPKTIHRMWLDNKVSDNTVPPKKYNRFIESFDKHNPEFRVEFWNMNRVKKLFDQDSLIKKYQTVWENLPHHIQKCDMARFIIMYLYGGVYIDLDFRCFKNLSPLLDRELLLVFEPIEHSDFDKTINRKIYNGFIGSVPKHQFWLDWLEFVCESVKKTDDVWLTTGPANFGIFWRQSKYRNIELIDTCDILPIYYCNDTHCFSRECANRIPEADYLSKNYYQKMGNYVDTLWNAGSGWNSGGKLETLENDNEGKLETLKNDNEKIFFKQNNYKFMWIIPLFLLIIIVIIIYLVFRKK